MSNFDKNHHNHGFGPFNWITTGSLNGNDFKSDSLEDDILKSKTCCCINGTNLFALTVTNIPKAVITVKRNDKRNWEEITTQRKRVHFHSIYVLFTYQMKVVAVFNTLHGEIGPPKQDQYCFILIWSDISKASVS